MRNAWNEISQIYNQSFINNQNVSYLPSFIRNTLTYILSYTLQLLQKKYMQLLCKLKTMLILKIRREREKKEVFSLSLFFHEKKFRQIRNSLRFNQNATSRNDRKKVGKRRIPRAREWEQSDGLVKARGRELRIQQKSLSLFLSPPG